MSKDAEGILKVRVDKCEVGRPLSQDSASQDAEYLSALLRTSVFKRNSLQECLLPEEGAISRRGTSSETALSARSNFRFLLRFFGVVVSSGFVAGNWC